MLSQGSSIVIHNLFIWNSYHTEFFLCIEKAGQVLFLPMLLHRYVKLQQVEDTDVQLASKVKRKMSIKPQLNTC